MAPRSDSALLGAEAGARAAAQTPEAFDEAQEREDQRLLGQLVGETEREVFHEAFEEEPPELDGDTSIEDAAGEDDLAGEETEDEDGEFSDDEAAELSPEGEIDDSEVEPERQRDRGDLNVALRQARDRIRELERAQVEAAGFQRGVESVSRQAQQQQQPPPEPDMFGDPVGWKQQTKAELKAEAIRELHETRVNASLAETHEQYGAEFQFAYNQFTSQPVTAETSALARRMVNSPDPGAWLMRWAEPALEEFRAQQQEAELERFAAMAEANPDILGALNQRLVGGRRQPAQRGREPTPTQRGARRMPPSINGAAGSSGRVGADARGFDGSDEAIFRYATEDL